ncbi:MAG: YqgE/AlgH family protein [Desulfobacterales bacterium]|nr:YqgE/AlgH family protein [Desulfobacterales bacterium]
MESLQGYFLISTPRMPDPRFQQRVVYICAHTEGGAMGLVVNEPIPDVSFAEILQAANIEAPEGLVLPSVYMGGPVGLNSVFILYSSDYQAPSRLEVTSTVCLSSEPRILRDIVLGQGPDDYVLTLGYSGWAPGQLESELIVDGWLVLPAENEILFKTPDEMKWKRAAQQYGIDITLFGDVVGSA